VILNEQKKNSLKTSLILVIISTLITLLIARVAFRVAANLLVVNYQPAPGEFVRQAGGQAWPGSNIFRAGNRKGEVNNFPLLHDRDGFTIGRVPEELLAQRLDGFTPAQRDMLMSSYINLSSLVDTGMARRPQVLMTVGDSNIRVNFEHLRQSLLPSEVRVSAALGVPSTGPDSYFVAVSRWLEGSGEIDRYLATHLDTDLEVDVYLTPHNDLEDLRPAPMPEQSRLALPPLPEPAAATAQPVAQDNKRDRLRNLTRLLGLNAAEITILRSAIARVLPQSVFSDRQSFTPTLDKYAFRKVLGYLDSIEQVLERYVTPDREVRMNLIVLPSVYDLPGLKLDYRWDELLDRYVAGEFAATGVVRTVRVRNLHFRELIQAWHPDDADYASLFHQGDLHYTLDGMVELSVALALRKGYLPQDWMDAEGMLVPERHAWLRGQLAERHARVMMALRDTLGETD
jgi:hypothetical protein